MGERHAALDLGGARVGEGLVGDTQHLADADDVGIGDVRVGGEQRVERKAEGARQASEGVARLDLVGGAERGWRDAQALGGGVTLEGDGAREGGVVVARGETGTQGVERVGGGLLDVGEGTAREAVEAAADVVEALDDLVGGEVGGRDVMLAKQGGTGGKAEGEQAEAWEAAQEALADGVEETCVAGVGELVEGEGFEGVGPFGKSGEGTRFGRFEVGRPVGEERVWVVNADATGGVVEMGVELIDPGLEGEGFLLEEVAGGIDGERDCFDERSERGGPGVHVGEGVEVRGGVALIDGREKGSERSSAHAGGGVQGGDASGEGERADGFDGVDDSDDGGGLLLDEGEEGGMVGIVEEIEESIEFGDEVAMEACGEGLETVAGAAGAAVEGGKVFWRAGRRQDIAGEGMEVGKGLPEGGAEVGLLAGEGGGCEMVEIGREGGHGTVPLALRDRTHVLRMMPGVYHRRGSVSRWSALQL
nr:hypothetical protein [Ardenticatena sp.]